MSSHSLSDEVITASNQFKYYELVPKMKNIPINLTYLTH